MKISIGTILIVGGLVYLLTRPTTALPLPDDGIIDPGDGNINPGGGGGVKPGKGDDGTIILPPGDGGNTTEVDVYNPDGTYHHTEVTNADGTVDIYVVDATGQMQYIMPKPGGGKPQTTTVSGVRGIGRKRCNGDSMGSERTFCGEPYSTQNVSGRYQRKRTAKPSFLI